MRLVTFAARGQTRLGVEAGEWIIDLNRAGQLHAARGGDGYAARAAALLPPSINEFLARGEEAMELAQDAADHLRGALDDTRVLLRLQQDGVVWLRKEIRLLPPVPAPPKILCVGRNYAEHAREGGGEPPTIPIYFGRFPHSLLGPGEPYVLPAVSEEVDYEGELAAVIGRRGHDIPESRA